jgi:hypothetical protein
MRGAWTGFRDQRSTILGEATRPQPRKLKIIVKGFPAPRAFGRKMIAPVSSLKSARILPTA